MSEWSSARLGDLVTIVGGGTPTRDTASFYDGGIPWVTPKDMKSWEIHGSQVTISQEGLDNSATRMVPADSILVVVRSGVLKHTLPVALNRVPVAINQDMKALLCDDRVAPDFLARFLKARSPVVLQWVRATTADNFPIDKLRQLVVPLPPLPEQRRIAEILDKADALRAKRRAALAQLDILTQSIFLDMFGDPAANPKGWPTATLEKSSLEGTDGLKRGPFGGALKKDIFVESGYKVYEQQHAIYKDCNIGTYYISESKYLNMQGFAVGPGDFIVSCSGTVGRIYRLPLSAPKGIINQALLRIRIDETKVMPLFFETMFESDAFQRSLLGGARGTGIDNFPPMERIRSIATIVPPPHLQLQFAERVAEVDELGASYRTSLAELNSLFASLKHRAFRGEL